MVVSLAPNFGWNNHQGLNFEVHLANFPISGWTQSRRSKSSGSWATSPGNQLGRWWVIWVIFCIIHWFQLEDTLTNLTFLINHRCKHRMSFIRKKPYDIDSFLTANIYICNPQRCGHHSRWPALGTDWTFLPTSNFAEHWVNHAEPSWTHHQKLKPQGSRAKDASHQYHPTQ